MDLSKDMLLIICIILNFNTVQMQQLFFSSPEESVEIITGLLLSEDWRTLSAYYIHDGNQELLDSLLSGDYFIRREMPELTHPGGFWRYRHPFSPGFKYHSHEQVADDLIKVNLIIEIDQGDGMMQVGKSSYLLKRSPEGYKILPGLLPEEPFTD